jgi:hypothetical protein
LQHLEDLAGTLSSEEAEDLPSIARLRAGLETIEHRRQRIAHQVRTDPSLLPAARGSPALTRLDEVSAEQTRIDSLALLEEILVELEAIVTEAMKAPGANHRALSAKLETLVLRSGGLAPADRAVADECVEAAREELPGAAGGGEAPPETHPPAEEEAASSEGSTANNADVAQGKAEGLQAIQWSVVQFSNGVTDPVVVKCGANDKLDLAVQSGAGKVAVLPVPGVLGGMDMEQIGHALGHVPGDLVQLAMARTADGTRARYTRLYKTLVRLLHDCFRDSVLHLTYSFVLLHLTYSFVLHFDLTGHVILPTFDPTVAFAGRHHVCFPLPNMRTIVHPPSRPSDWIHSWVQEL